VHLSFKIIATELEEIFSDNFYNDESHKLVEDIILRLS